ncbi:MAG TPA: hypothetical protein VFY29_15635 [Terriglobia bacterium]|nr:hypothetical protein [Terriglobia bacterium]
MTTLTYFPGITVRKEATVVTVTSGAAITGVDFRLLNVLPARMSGRIVSEDGQPAIQSVGLISREIVRPGVPSVRLPTRSLVSVQADGSFEFPLTQPGYYFLMANGGERPLVLTAGVDSTIAVEGRDVTGLEMTLERNFANAKFLSVPDSLWAVIDRPCIRELFELLSELREFFPKPIHPVFEVPDFRLQRFHP